MSGFNLPGTMTSDDFLDAYWQRRVLVCPGALAGLVPVFDPDDLLDIACEPQSQARLVIREALDWQVAHGPFDPSFGDALPDGGWSLLVQSMEVWVPELHDLIAMLAFLPRWRTDDIMVSLSASGGGVGPHVDQYDVFLVQASGRRSWAFGGPVSDFLPDRPLRLLADFRPEEQHVLEPGDVLYLPPGIPHDGVALDDGCVTVSIGFRAPGVSDLVSKLADQLLTRWEGDVEHEPRFRDPGRASCETDPTRLDPGDAEAMAALVGACLADPDQAMRLAGELMSEPRMPPDPPETMPAGADLMARLVGGGRLERWAGSRLSHGPAADGRAFLFADGGSIVCAPELAATLAGATAIDGGVIDLFPAQADLADVLAWLVAQGTFGFPED
jgi:50S ribosomal protein L16 3-hydroxylase